jgi:hypothetical protein
MRLAGLCYFAVLSGWWILELCRGCASRLYGRCSCCLSGRGISVLAAAGGLYFWWFAAAGIHRPEQQLTVFPQTWLVSAVGIVWWLLSGQLSSGWLLTKPLSSTMWPVDHATTAGIKICDGVSNSLIGTSTSSLLLCPCCVPLTSHT